MTDSQDIENGYETKHGWWMTVEYKSGKVTMEHITSSDLPHKGSNWSTLHKITITQGWCARPIVTDDAGFWDATDWLGPYESIEQATEALANHSGVSK